MRVALVALGLLGIAAVLFFASFTEAEPEGISASDHYRGERLIELTRDELDLLQQKLDALNELLETMPKSDQEERAKVDAEYSTTMEQWAAAKSRITAIERALTDDSREALDDVFTQIRDGD